MCSRTPVSIMPKTFAVAPMALAGGHVFVPVLDLCMNESAITSPSVLQRPASEGRGSVYALDARTGATAWQAPLGSAPFALATT